MTQYNIELQNIPNQQFSVNINNIDMLISLRYCEGIMLFSLQINGGYVCPDVPCFAGQGILPYPYMVEEAGGQFFFDTENDEYPNYENFTTSSKLYFVTKDELF